jgi:hypothetical protein
MGFYGFSVYHCIPLYWFCQNVNNEKQLPRFGFVRFCFGELRTMKNNGVQLVFCDYIYEYMNIWIYILMYIYPDPDPDCFIIPNPIPNPDRPDPEGPNPDPDCLWIPILLLAPIVLGLGPIHLAPLHRIRNPIRLKLAHAASSISVITSKAWLSASSSLSIP